MAITQSIKIADLKLDLANFRTIHQPNEVHAINALIAIRPERFWALMESLLEDGYSPTENIIVLKTGNKLMVKEGNRRVASLKIIYGLVKDVELPDHIQSQIGKLSEDWKKANQIVPCAIYPLKDAAFVDKLVSRTHAKGEASGRDKWTSVARARYARDQSHKSEPGLDLLESYLENGKNHTAFQAERWAGDYPLTVLDEAIKKLAPHIGFKSSKDLVSKYPHKKKRLLDKILLAIGISHLGFKQLRAKIPFWGHEYGIQLADDQDSTKTNSGGNNSGQSKRKADAQSGTTGSHTSNETDSKGSKSVATFASNDPRSVKRILNQFKVRGKGREKIVTLVDEIKKLKIKDHPHAFCFLLRCIFELSAKAYCADHRRSGGPNTIKKGGNDKNLKDLLREITSHITNNKKDREKLKKIHGAMTELGKPDGLLSVTSMNQLIHNPSFSVTPPDICILFGNLFPLLDEMNG